MEASRSTFTLHSMTASRTYRPRAFLAAALLLGGVTLAACGSHPSSAPPMNGSPSAAITPAAGSATAPVTSGTGVAATGIGAPATMPVATPAAAATSPAAAAAQTAQVTQDLAGISSQLAAAGQDLQDGPTQQTIDPRG
jgi:hypothetical protein